MKWFTRTGVLLALLVLGGCATDASTAPEDVPDEVPDVEEETEVVSTEAMLDVGGHHSCWLREGDAVFCWGMNRYGQVGNGSFTEVEHRPSSVESLGS